MSSKSNTISKNQLLINFSKIDQVSYKCNLCSKIYKTPNGGVGNLRVHYATHTRINDVSGKRKRQMLITPLPNDDEQDPDNPGGTSEETATKTNQLERVKKQLLMPNLINNIMSITVPGRSKEVNITNSIVYYICKENVPFSVVESEGFKKMVKTMCPLYKVPGRDTIRRQINYLFEIMANRFREELVNVDQFSITCDVWTETMTMRSFLGITIHFFKDIQMQSRTIGTVELFESHTGDYLGQILNKTLAEWNIPKEKIAAVITDSGANIKKAITDLFGINKHISCLAHTVNLIVEKSIEKTQIENAITKERKGGVPELVGKVRDIVKYFKKSTKASDELRKRQKLEGTKEGKYLKLKLDVRTRWNSVFYMIERFLELSKLLSDILLTRTETDVPEMVTARELNCLKEICSILQPMEVLTRELSVEKYVMSSKIIPLIFCIESQIEKLPSTSDMARKLKIKLLEEITYRCGKIEQTNLLPICTLLDPRFKDMYFKDPLANSKAQEKILRMIKASSEVTSDLPRTNSTSTEQTITPEPNCDQFDLWSPHKRLLEVQNKKSRTGCQYRDELRTYLEGNAILRKDDPMIEWENTKTIYPELYKLARKYLCISATSVPSERLFSKAGATVSQSRNRLLGSTLSKLLFLQSLDEEYWTL